MTAQFINLYQRRFSTCQTLITISQEHCCHKLCKNSFIKLKIIQLKCILKVEGKYQNHDFENLVLFYKHFLASVQFSAVAQSCLTLCYHMMQHARLPCSSPNPGACSNSCPLSQWCHPTISPSVVAFSSCLHSFPASGSFPVSQFFASGGQILEFQLRHQSFQWVFRTDLL